MAEETITDVEPIPETEQEIREEEQHLPSTEERLEHCYAELRAIRAEIAELRSHSHSDLAHATHEHEQYAAHDHKHELSPERSETTEPLGEHESGGGNEHDDSPTPTHPYFRKVHFKGF